jgi:hypothetical protein
VTGTVSESSSGPACYFDTQQFDLENITARYQATIDAASDIYSDQGSSQIPIVNADNGSVTDFKESMTSGQAAPTLVSARTALAYTGPTSGDYGSVVGLSATLKRVDTSAGVPNQPVTIRVGSESCTATTTSSGAAACDVTLGESPKPSPYPINATFAGSGVFVKSSDTSHTFTGHRAATSLTASPVLPGGASATLRVARTAKALAGQTVVFSAGGHAFCTATTNGSGTANCGLSMSQPAVLALGYTASYAGSSSYLPATATGPLL